MGVAVDRMVALLRDNTTPVFLDVFVGEPIGLPPDGPYASLRYLGDSDPPEGMRTMGNYMREERFQVRVYWHKRPERATHIDWEKDIVAGKQALRAAFAGDVFLNNSGSSRVVDALDIGDAQCGYVRMSDGMEYRVLEFELRLRDLNAEEETG